MTKPEFRAKIGRTQLEGIGRQGVTAAFRAFAMTVLLKLVGIIAAVTLSLWVSQEGNLVQKYVAYYVIRSLTGEPDGCELTKQRDKVAEFVGREASLVKEFVGIQAPNRKGSLFLKAALNAARRQKAKLIVGDLTALLEDDKLVDMLRRSHADFLALDMPEFDRNTIGKLAESVARRREQRLEEARQHSQRTKQGLRIAKAHGTQIGNPIIIELQKKASNSAKIAAEEFRTKLRTHIIDLHREGLSLRAIANRLNRDGIPSARKRSWYASSVRRILEEAKAMVVTNSFD